MVKHGRAGAWVGVVVGNSVYGVWRLLSRTGGAGERITASTYTRAETVPHTHPQINRVTYKKPHPPTHQRPIIFFPILNTAAVVITLLSLEMRFI